MRLNQGDVKLLAKALDDLKRDMAEEVREHPRAPAQALQMLSWHLDKPWVPDFWTVLISPLKPTLRSYLKLSVMRAGDRVWYFPSAQWWVAHARASHPPDGSGCDVDVHTAFLTERGKNAEFAYANLLKDSSLQVCEEEDFSAECAWWRRKFGREGPAK